MFLISVYFQYVFHVIFPLKILLDWLNTTHPSLFQKGFRSRTGEGVKYTSALYTLSFRKYSKLCLSYTLDNILGQIQCLPKMKNKLK